MLFIVKKTHHTDNNNVVCNFSPFWTLGYVHFNKVQMVNAIQKIYFTDFMLFVLW